MAPTLSFTQVQLVRSCAHSSILHINDTLYFTDKLGVDPETVKKSVEAMMYLLLECAKTMVTAVHVFYIDIGAPLVFISH